MWYAQRLSAGLGHLLSPTEGYEHHAEVCKLCQGKAPAQWDANCKDHFRDELDKALRELGGASLELHDRRRALGGRGRDD